jgi:uncharacterized RDD family membrane protein YckC
VNEVQLRCPRCGANLAEGQEICGSCGESANRSSAQSNQAGQGLPGQEIAPTGFAKPHPVVYAGFWLRLFAYLLDSLLLGIVVGAVILRPLMERAGISPDNPWVLFTGDSRQIIAINLLVTMASWLYWATLESSVWQATFGKRIFGLQVTDMAGRRVSFARASGRHFGKLIFVGFILAGFTEKKQALHDIMAGCLVIRKPSTLVM